MSLKNEKKSPLSRAALDLVAARFRVLGETTRLELLQHVMNGEKSVQDLCNLTGLSQANVSKHLSLMAEQGIIVRRKQGLFAYYTIGDDSVYQLCDLVCGALARRFSQAGREFQDSP